MHLDSAVKLAYPRKQTLGTDPEMFVFAGSKLIPAFEFLPGKTEPNSMIYWDGFQAEWKFDQPLFCQNNLIYSNRLKLIALKNLATKYNKDAKLSIRNVVRIPKETLKNASYHHVELGCEPSFNVYGLKGKEVSDPRRLPYRFAGGHMHFGTWPLKPNYDKIVMMLDAILGVWAVGAAQSIDVPLRREYYGLPGEFRAPQYSPWGGGTYGVEYRVLSNFWLAHPAITQISWELGRLAVRLAGSKYRKFWVASKEEVIEAITNCDHKLAARILKRNKEMFLWMLDQKLVYTRYHSNKAFEVGLNGIEQVIKDPNDIQGNWHFHEEWLKNAGQPWARWTRYVDSLP